MGRGRRERRTGQGSEGENRAREAKEGKTRQKKIGVTGTNDLTETIH